MLIKTSNNFSLIKYGITGIIFTFVSPIIFIYLSNYFSRVLVILITIPVAYALKFVIYKSWVFKNGRVNFKNYIIHILPLYLIAILIARTTANIENVQYVALIIILINALLGYFWGNYLYSAPFKKNPKKKKLIFF